MRGSTSRNAGLNSASCSSTASLRLLDRRPHQVAPLGPRPVVVLDVVEAEQMLEREPGDARPFTDAAICDDRLIAADPLGAVQRSQVVEALERAVLVAVLAPRDALGAGNVAAALAGF